MRADGGKDKSILVSFVVRLYGYVCGRMCVWQHSAVENFQSGHHHGKSFTVFFILLSKQIVTLKCALGFWLLYCQPLPKET